MTWIESSEGPFIGSDHGSRGRGLNPMEHAQPSLIKDPKSQEIKDVNSIAIELPK